MFGVIPVCKFIFFSYSGVIKADKKSIYRYSYYIIDMLPKISLNKFNTPP